MTTLQVVALVYWKSPNEH